MSKYPKRDWSGKYPKITFRIRRDFRRVSPELLEVYGRSFVPDVSDLVGRMYTMDSSIRPLYSPSPKICGTALTVKCPPGDNAAVKRALLLVQPGDVMVIDAQGFTEWCLGGFGMLMKSIRERGLRGLVVNGAYRDITQAQEATFPIFAKGIAPWSGPKRGPGEINVPVCAGGVIVHPGDVVLGDDDGVAVVPLDYIEVIANELRGIQLKPKAEDWTDDYLVHTENEQGDYIESLIQEKGVVYLD